MTNYTTRKMSKICFHPVPPTGVGREWVSPTSVLIYIYIYIYHSSSLPLPPRLCIINVSANPAASCAKSVM